MRLILIGFRLYWRDWLPVGGMQVYSQAVKKKSQLFIQLRIMLGL